MMGIFRRLASRGTLCLIGVALLLQACGTTERRGPSAIADSAAGPKAAGLYKVGQPYQVNGIWYYPSQDLSYDETGIASWYGPGFHEQNTANGEVFDQNDVSAAHKTLPLPSIVQVTNLDNGRSIQVRVNDRGPFVGNRIIDMSRRAAQLLAFELQGTAKVRVRVLLTESLQAQALARLNGVSGGAPAEPAPHAAPVTPVVAEALPPPVAGVQPQPAEPPAPRVAVAATEPLPAPLPLQQGLPAPAGPPLPLVVTQYPVHSTRIFVQAGAFSNNANAERMRARLTAIGAVSITAARVNGLDLFRVRVGPIGTVDEADQVLNRAVGVGASEARIVVE